ncbi:hypothetical protein [Paenibacillus amylolyticus]|uniref:hypothetical protein n=1 Tax=Paenibacillus amylolyticus TaxID=1451 RepID=UPI00201DC4AB|nr:hypothetical protein [Paenibacillus amylolyticus]MCL6661756.1 hypothetical protein [Paenibacillus amylolyticus]
MNKHYRGQNHRNYTRQTPLVQQGLKYVKDWNTGQIYGVPHFTSGLPGTQTEPLLSCNCCVYTNPQNQNERRIEHSSGECPRTTWDGWKLETTYYDCSAWHC